MKIYFFPVAEIKCLLHESEVLFTYVQPLSSFFKLKLNLLKRHSLHVEVQKYFYKVVLTMKYSITFITEKLDYL